MKGQTEGGRRDGRGLPAPSIHSLAACRIASAPRAFCCSSTRLSLWPTSVVNSEAWALTARVAVWAASFMPWVKLSAVWRALVPTACEPCDNRSPRETCCDPTDGWAVPNRDCPGVRRERSGVLDPEPARDVEPTDAPGERHLSMSASGWETFPRQLQERHSSEQRLAADGKGPVTASLRIGPRPALRLGPRACAGSLRGRPAGRCRNGLE